MKSQSVVLITGGGRGLGRAYAEALARAGAQVAVTARSADELTETVALIEQAAAAAWRCQPMSLTSAPSRQSSLPSKASSARSTC